MNRHGIFSLALALLLIAGNPAAGQQNDFSEQIRGAVAKALPLLEKGAAGHLAKRTCFSCHNQAVPVFAVQVARQRGFDVDDALFDKQLGRTHDILTRWAKQSPDRKSFAGGQADTAVYTLLTLDIGERKSDPATAAVVDYLLYRDRERGYWRATHDNRLPSEGSSFTTTALAIRGLQAFGTAEQQEAIAKRIESARAWLLGTKPRDTEDRVFRLWGLKHAGAEPKEIDAAVAELLKTQRDDGGWAQTATMDSDAYATGSALVALHVAGGVPTTDPAYQRGLRCLLGEQQPDGSWYVLSRSANRFQVYFETGFPYDEDQWISVAASAWATTALGLALPASEP